MLWTLGFPCFYMLHYSRLSVKASHPHYLCLTSSEWLGENPAVTTAEPTADDSERTTCHCPQQELKATGWGL